MEFNVSLEGVQAFENDMLIGSMTFEPQEDGVVAITKTFVDPSKRGCGIAGLLMDRAFSYLSEQGIFIKPVCSYVVAWAEKHPSERFVGID